MFFTAFCFSFIINMQLGASGYFITKKPAQKTGGFIDYAPSALP
jgi:hypothetical protein